MDLPETLAAMHRVTFTWEQYDYLGYAAFWTPQKTTDWLRAWTGNKSLNGTQFLVFGADGSGGQIAIWLAHLRVALSEQPVVFFGSEGARAVVAQNLADFSWLLAGGIGPLEPSSTARERALPTLDSKLWPDSTSRTPPRHRPRFWTRLQRLFQSSRPTSMACATTDVITPVGPTRTRPRDEHPGSVNCPGG